MTSRLWIARALWIAAGSLCVAVVSGLLSLVLGALGDASGAEAVRGVALVMTTVFVLAIVALVILLAINELRRSEPPGENKSN